jgi:hypothetical protein
MAVPELPGGGRRRRLLLNQGITATAWLESELSSPPESTDVAT